MNPKPVCLCFLTAACVDDEELSVCPNVWSVLVHLCQCMTI